MQVSREYLLELDKKRLQIEKEIFDLTDYLTGDGMPGVSGSLIDREGFPLPGIDLTAVRTARNKLIMLQNDLTNIMKIIEEKMSNYFAQKPETQVIEKKNEDQEEGIKVHVYEEEPVSKTNVLKVPFCWIGMVTEGSPADEAGLLPGDGIIQFDKLTFGMSNNPLKSISEIVNKKIDEPIPVVVKREIEDNVEYIDIKLIPHSWTGQGLLGCKLNLEQ
jgi:26S proteasome non-ATPase regulatory subunit 9